MRRVSGCLGGVDEDVGQLLDAQVHPAAHLPRRSRFVAVSVSVSASSLWLGLRLDAAHAGECDVCHVQCAMCNVQCAMCNVRAVSVSVRLV
jgi:hypothetical protein